MIEAVLRAARAFFGEVQSDHVGRVAPARDRDVALLPVERVVAHVDRTASVHHELRGEADGAVGNCGRERLAPPAHAPVDALDVREVRDPERHIRGHLHHVESAEVGRIPLQAAVLPHLRSNCVTLVEKYAKY